MGSETLRYSEAVAIAMTIVAIVLSVNVADGGIVKYTKLWLEQIEHTFMDTPGSNQPQPYTAHVEEVPRSDIITDDNRPNSGYNPLLKAKSSGGAFVPSKSSDGGTKKNPVVAKGKNNADDNVLMCMMRPSKKNTESDSKDGDDDDRSTVTGGAKALTVKNDRRRRQN